MNIKDFEKENYDVAGFSTDAIIQRLKQHNKPVIITLCTIGCAVMVLFVYGALSITKMTYNNLRNSEVILTFSSNLATAASNAKDTISVPSGIVKANPFLPYRNIDGIKASDTPIFEIIAPPETINEGSDASRVMDTIVSGILYDKSNSSAILNIEGNDYLVKKGDTVNNYKILDIQRDSVTVKLGSNTYKAGIGEILTEGTVNYNDVSNLKNKFGGKK